MKRDAVIVFFLIIGLLGGLFNTSVDNVAVAATYDLTGWDEYITITIDNSFISATLYDFPILVKINSTIAAQCDDDGKSIRFINFDGELLHYEIEEWNVTENSTVWVELDTIWHSTDTDFYMYYNNSDSSDAQNIEGTWDANFICVQHLNETSGTHYDSTSKDNDSTAITVFKQGNATGMVSGCDDFERANSDEIEMPSTGDLGDLHTIEFWFKHESLADYESFFGNIAEIQMLSYSDGHLNFQGGASAAKTVTEDTWYYFAGVSDNTDSRLLLGNTSLGTVLQYGAKTVGTDFTSSYNIGNTNGQAYYFDGLIDEFRISNIARSDAYINATYHTVNQTTGFLTYGGETTVAAGTGWKPYTPSISPEEITFEGYVSGYALKLNYSDSLSQTINTKMDIYEINKTTGTTTTLSTDTKTGNNSYNISVNIDCNNDHYVILNANHTSFGWFKMQLWFTATNNTALSSEKDYLWNALYGGTPFGWHNIMMWVFVCICLFSFGQRGAGIALIVTGGMSVFITSYVNFNTAFETVAAGAIPVLMIIVGIMIAWRNVGRDNK